MGQVDTSYVYNFRDINEGSVAERIVNEATSVFSAQKEDLLSNMDVEVYNYISQHVILQRSSVLLKKIKSKADLNAKEFQGKTSFVSLTRLNDMRYINRFLIEVNKCMSDANIFIGNVETSENKRNQILKSGKNIFSLLYWFYCFFFHRVLSKIKYLNKLYFVITRGKYRWLTQAETLGRLVSCGFDIIEFRIIKNVVYFVAIKTREPDDNQKPSYGPVFPMKRIGKDGKLIKVYKFRTMHPYSEYLQSYIIKLNGYNELGKPANDFRLADWGRFMRKYWLDELPQLINLLKGEITLVGVRPLSITRFNELPEEVKILRTKFKPGWIPPYVSLNMPDSEGNIKAEKIYLEEKLKNGYKTDIKYFCMAMYNILTGKITSM